MSLSLIDLRREKGLPVTCFPIKVAPCVQEMFEESNAHCGVSILVQITPFQMGIVAM